jgi:opacity protein-like surface antigen
MMNKMNLNKTLLALTISCLSSSLFAHYNSPFDGFYVGAAAGGSWTNVNQDQVIDGIFNSLPADIDFEVNLPLQIDGPNSLKTDPSFKGALYAGYGQSWDIWYLGAEIFVDLANYKNRNGVELDLNNTVDENVVFEFQGDTHSKLRSFQYGVDLRPGVIVTPDTMLYGRVGVAASRLNLNTNAVFAGNDASDDILWDLMLPLATAKNVAALRLGAGLEQNIGPNINFRFDYIYTYYGRASVGGATQQLIPAIGGNVILNLASNTSVKAYNNTVMLGLTYLLPY